MQPSLRRCASFGFGQLVFGRLGVLSMHKLWCSHTLGHLGEVAFHCCGHFHGSPSGDAAAEGTSSLHVADVCASWEQVGAIQQLILMALSDNEVVVEQACKTIGGPQSHCSVVPGEEPSPTQHLNPPRALLGLTRC